MTDLCDSAAPQYDDELTLGFGSSQYVAAIRRIFAQLFYFPLAHIISAEGNIMGADFTGAGTSLCKSGSRSKKGNQKGEKLNVLFHKFKSLKLKKV